MAEIKKRKRSANWEAMEKKLLKQCLKDYVDVVENKRTDTNTNKEKKLAWINVGQSFNELNNKIRTLAEIKQQWRTMKIDAKKSNSDYKWALKATGTPTTKKPILKSELRSMKRTHASIASTQNTLIAETAKEQNTAVTNSVVNEHNLKMKQMAEAHEWARLEHELKVENIRLQNKYLEVQINQKLLQ